MRKEDLIGGDVVHRKQHKTPKSEQNVQMEVNRPEHSYYVVAQKCRNGRAFYTQKAMAQMRHIQTVINAIRKRGGKAHDLHPYDSVPGVM